MQVFVKLSWVKTSSLCVQKNDKKLYSVDLKILSLSSNVIEGL